MSFPWMTPTPARADDERRIDMYRRELGERAALLCRLGYPPAVAIARLRANLAWDFEIGAGPRPEALTEAAVAELVQRTYARRAAR